MAGRVHWVKDFWELFRQREQHVSLCWGRRKLPESRERAITKVAQTVPRRAPQRGAKKAIRPTAQSFCYFPQWGWLLLTECSSPFIDLTLPYLAPTWYVNSPKVVALSAAMSGHTHFSVPVWKIPLLSHLLQWQASTSRGQKAFPWVCWGRLQTTWWKWWRPKALKEGLANVATTRIWSHCLSSLFWALWKQTKFLVYWVWFNSFWMKPRSITNLS